LYVSKKKIKKKAHHNTSYKEQNERTFMCVINEAGEKRKKWRFGKIGVCCL
jgi:hypothetical protein